MNAVKMCPCHSGVIYTECCAALLSGAKNAGTAEALMRSRYSAYVAGDSAYLLRTWHPSTRPSRLDLDQGPDWCRLEILRTEQGREEDNEGVVEFKATAVSHQKIVELHEVSRFVKESGHWLYVSGDMQEDSLEEGLKTIKVGRNHPCPCGSGRKFKRCCGP